MTAGMALELAAGMLGVTLMVLGPILAVVMVVGLAVSLFQALTQINEMTLTFVPKLAVVGVLLLVMGPWMLGTLVDYTTQLIELMPQVVR